MNSISPAVSPPDERSPLLDRALVSAFLENVPDHVYFKDRQSRFIALSKSLARLFSLEKPADAIGKTDFDFFSIEHAQPAFEDEQRIMRTSEPMIGALEKEVWRDGRITWVLSSKLPLRNEHGEIIGTFGISKDVTSNRQMELALEKANRELVEASRVAGMAEVATGVLHNVGNVLNSLNVSATVLAKGVRDSKAESLAKLGALLREHEKDLAQFLTADPKGKRVPEFIESLAKHGIDERERLLREIDSLQQNIDHIKEIVSMQQAYATMVGVIEALDPEALMDDSIRMNSGALVRHDVSVVRDFQPAPRVVGEKGKILQILINLIRNAKYACDESGRTDKIVTLRIRPAGQDRVQFVVQDNGVGIPPENLPRIFSHGFTTRANGHGFGLHSAASAARDMKGSLTVFSEGQGKGAVFTLELPTAPASVPGE